MQAHLSWSRKLALSGLHASCKNNVSADLFGDAIDAFCGTLVAKLGMVWWPCSSTKVVI